MSLRERIEALGPDRTERCAAAIELADACYALEAGFREVLGGPAPDSAERFALRELALARLRAWIPRIDPPTLAALKPRVRERNMPIDLKARAAELKTTRLADHAAELAPYAALPPLEGWQAVAALFVEEWVAIGEHPAAGLVLDAEPGVWLAYQRSRELADDNDGPADELLGVHADHVANVSALLDTARRLPEHIPIDAARMVIADDNAVKDEDLVEALWNNHVDDYRGYAAQVFVSGDGRAFVRNATIDGRSVLVCVGMD